MSDSLSPILVAAGPREAERRVLDWVLERRARDAGALWPPVRVVVPSRSLARHLVAVLVRELGALAGVVVQTHRALAREVFERAGGTPPPGGSAVQEVLVRQLAAEQEALRVALGELEDGYAAVAAAVRDLVDAGLDATNVEAVAEAVAATTAGTQRERCLAVVEVARRWLGGVERDGLPGRSGLLVRATELLERGDSATLPSRAILIHGFAEATGLVSGLLEALVRHHGAVAVVDLPPDPARPGERDAGWRFAERLADRLAGAGATARAAAAPPSGPGVRPALFVAPGPEAEIREIAGRIRRLLDTGVRPESVALVVRRVDDELAAAVRRQFGRLGIPFSGEGASVPSGAPARRAGALTELLLRGADAPAAAWLESAGPGTIPGGPRLAGLVLRTVGAATIRDAAALDVEAACAGKETLRLPVIEGAGEHDGILVRRRRTVDRSAVAAIARAAGELRRLLDRRPASGDAAAVAGWFAALFRLLGPAGGPVTDAEGAIREILTSLETAGELRWEALAPVLAGRLASIATAPAGGRGGGVAVLGVTEARGRTFGHLFLAGLRRGVFPFRRPEDPLLPEIARRRLRAVLPEIPLASRSPLEERYLFAQLSSSAGAVTLSWAATDHDGRATNPSAFLERLSLEGRLEAPLRGEDRPLVADVFDPGRGGSVRPPVEHLVAAGLRGDRDTVASMLRAAAGPAGGHAARVLDLLDPPRRPEPALGPFDGAVGNPPSGELWVTRLEAVSRCPFQAFLERDLGIEAPPEAGAGLDRLGGALLGSVVHATLEALVRDQGLPSDVELEAARRRDARKVAWPEPSRLEELTVREARRVAAREGRPALALALARRALGFLERAREIDWAGGGPAVLGVELRGAAGIPLGRETVAVRFRADRVDRREDGALVLTDYKTGSVDNAVKATTCIQYARQGKLLQGAVYALATPGGAVGRYLALREGLAPDGRTVALDGTTDHAAIAAAAGLAVGEILACLGTGTMFPRVDGRDAPCDRCAVRLACLRDDSSYRRRIVDAMAALREDDPVRRLWEQRGAKMPEEAS